MQIRIERDEGREGREELLVGWYFEILDGESVDAIRV
jgi:hypothetical protein